MASPEDLGVITTKRTGGKNVSIGGKFQGTYRKIPVTFDIKGSATTAGVGGASIKDEEDLFDQALDQNADALNQYGVDLTNSFFSTSGLDDVPFYENAESLTRDNLTDRVKNVIKNTRGQLFEQVILNLQNEVKREATLRGADNDPIDINATTHAGTNVTKVFGQKKKFEVKGGSFSSANIKSKYAGDIIGNAAINNTAGSVNADAGKQLQK